MKEDFRKEIELQSESPTAEHRNRFLDKLESRERKLKSNTSGAKERSGGGTLRWLIGLASAAVIAWGIFSVNYSPNEEGFATQKFNPVNAINKRSAQLESVYSEYVQPRISQVLEHDPKLIKQIELLDQLDREYLKLKTLFIQTKGSEKVSKEMIRNHKLRLKIMEQMLNQLELMKSKKSNQNEIKSA